MPKLWHKKREEQCQVLLIFTSYDSSLFNHFYYTLTTHLLHTFGIKIRVNICHFIKNKIVSKTSETLYFPYISL